MHLQNGKKFEDVLKEIKTQVGVESWTKHKNFVEDKKIQERDTRTGDGKRLCNDM